MTTKEEVLRLAEENCYMVHHRAVHTGYEFNVKQLTKIVALAKAQGAAEERDACLKLAQDLADMYAEREYYRCSELRTDAETGLRELEEAIRARNK